MGGLDRCYISEPPWVDAATATPPRPAAGWTRQVHFDMTHLSASQVLTFFVAKRLSCEAGRPWFDSLTSAPAPPPPPAMWGSSGPPPLQGRAKDDAHRRRKVRENYDDDDGQSSVRIGTTRAPASHNPPCKAPLQTAPACKLPLRHCFALCAPHVDNCSPVPAFAPYLRRPAGEGPCGVFLGAGAVAPHWR